MHAVTDSPATTNQEAPQACHGVGASTGNDDIACACKRGDGTQGEGQAARTPAPATHTRTRHAQPAESRVYGTRCLAAVAHQLKLPLDTRAIPPTSRRQEKKAEHSGQHDRRQRASQSTHTHAHKAAAPRGAPHTPTAAVTQPPSRLVCVLQQTWHTEAAVGQQGAPASKE